MVYIWYVPADRAEEVHDIFVKSKKESTLIKRMNELCKRYKGLATSSKDITPGTEERYNEDSNWGRIEYTPKDTNK